jgi:iron(III) transport system substrate-binding protein
MKNSAFLRTYVAVTIGFPGCFWLFGAQAGCERPAPDTASSRPAAEQAARVVVYTSVDEVFAREILDEFSRRTGIAVEASFDSEAGKTTGFLNKLRREAQRPRCDVWWSGEVFGTIELAREGLFELYESPGAADIPPAWRDPNGRWTGLAARARVVAFNPRRFAAAGLPQTWEALTAHDWAGKSAVANPQFGTTRGHIAAMFAYWGGARGRAALQSLRSAGAKLADGNSHCVRLVTSGAVDLGWTDTDDVWVNQRRGAELELIYPRLDEGLPPVWVPCTVALVRSAPGGAAGRKLVDYLVSAEVEAALARSDSRNVPVREKLRAELSVAGPVPEPLDFERIADALPEAMAAARTILLR